MTQPSGLVNRRAGIEESSFQSRLFALLREHARPAEKFGHQPRLYALTRIAGNGSDYDDDIVCAAAYLHDLGVFTGHRPEDPARLSHWDHVAYAVEKSPALLRSIGFPEEKIPAVIEAIKTHQPKDAPDTIEGVILRDADNLQGRSRYPLSHVYACRRSPGACPRNSPRQNQPDANTACGRAAYCSTAELS
jgi:hypothetical protein